MCEAFESFEVCDNCFNGPADVVDRTVVCFVVFGECAAGWFPYWGDISAADVATVTDDSGLAVGKIFQQSGRLQGCSVMGASWQWIGDKPWFVVEIAGQVDIHSCLVVFTGVVFLGGPGSPR